MSATNNRLTHKPLIPSRLTSVTDFKRYSTRSLAELGDREALLVLVHDRPAFYVLTPDMLASLLAGGVRGDHEDNNDG